MERKMRRFKQMLAKVDCDNILAKATNGILSLVDTDGAPYGVPMSFVYDGHDSIYLHSAVNGHKIDCIRHDRRCSFAVVDQDMVVPEEFTTYYRSVIVTGRIVLLDGDEEIHKGLIMLGEKYSPGIYSGEEIAKSLDHVMVMRLDIESMTGKESIELVRAKSRRI